MSQIMFSQLSPAEFQTLVRGAVKDELKQFGAVPVAHSPFSKIPVTEIFKQRYMSRPTFYQHVKDGVITIYKLGKRSYVDAVEFNQAFKAVEVA